MEIFSAFEKVPVDLSNLIARRCRRTRTRILKIHERTHSSPARECLKSILLDALHFISNRLTTFLFCQRPNHPLITFKRWHFFFFTCVSLHLPNERLFDCTIIWMVLYKEIWKRNVNISWFVSLNVPRTNHLLPLFSSFGCDVTIFFGREDVTSRCLRLFRVDAVKQSPHP